MHMVFYMSTLEVTDITSFHICKKFQFVQVILEDFGVVVRINLNLKVDKFFAIQLWWFESIVILGGWEK